jgi:hypothetical protein
MDKAGVQAVVVQAFFDPYRAILIDLATKYRLAYMSGSREVTAAGGLVSTCPSFTNEQQSTLTKSSRVQSPPIYPWSSHKVSRGDQCENGESAWPDDLTNIACPN